MIGLVGAIGGYFLYKSLKKKPKPTQDIDATVKILSVVPSPIIRGQDYILTSQVTNTGFLDHTFFIQFNAEYGQGGGWTGRKIPLVLISGESVNYEYSEKWWIDEDEPAGTHTLIINIYDGGGIIAQDKIIVVVKN